MLSRPSWMSSQAPASAPVPGSTPFTPTVKFRGGSRQRDPNEPDHRLQIGSKCIYERELPGGSYITAHVNRLQCGYYDSPVIHEDCIDNVRFLAIHFVFHEASTDRRFKSARIKLSIHDENQTHGSIVPVPPQLNRPTNNNDQRGRTRRLKPKFLKYAPHLLYGAMSPETLDWNFNLAGSLGVSQTPVSASINPSGGIKSSYKIYKMMKIQGSLRTNNSWFGKNYDVEDGELVWTLEENYLQKSGLPREFTFVVLLTKGDDMSDIRFEIDIEPDVAAWFGEFPQWWIHLLKYQPLYKQPLDLDKEIGQRFEPSDGELGFNFAQLMTLFDDFVSLPGTTYSTRDWGARAGRPAASTPVKKDDNQTKEQSKTSASGAELGAGQETPQNTLHLRIHLDPPPKTSYSISSFPYPEPATTSRHPPASTLPASTPASQSSAQRRATPDSRSKPSKLSRRVTVGGTPTLTPIKQKSGPKQQLIKPVDNRESQASLDPQTSSRSDAEEEECEFSFPESITPAKSPPQSQLRTNSQRRQATSSSTTSSSAFEPSLPEQPLTTAHSLRRTHSRSGLRSASISSQPHPQPDSSLEPDPESEVAISAAMDMLSGSPPPPCTSPVPAAPDPPPVFGPAPALITTRKYGVEPMIKPGPPTLITTTRSSKPDMSLATPRTRAALADRMEIEKAERDRFERRNGNKENQPVSTASGPKMPQTPLEEPNRRLRPGVLSRNSSDKKYTDNTVDMNGNKADHGPTIGVGPRSGIGMDDSFVVDDSRERERERKREQTRQKRYSLPVTSMGIGYPSFGSTSTTTDIIEEEDQTGRSENHNGDISDQPSRSMMNQNGSLNNAGTHRDSHERIGLGVNNNNSIMGNGRSSLMIPIGGAARNKRDIAPSQTGIRNHAAETGVLGTGHVVNLDTNTITTTAGATGGFRRDVNPTSVYPAYEYIE